MMAIITKVFFIRIYTSNISSNEATLVPAINKSRESGISLPEVVYPHTLLKHFNQRSTDRAECFPSNSTRQKANLRQT
jgi:hypothetical protein